jgi:hypothetical protein
MNTSLSLFRTIIFSLFMLFLSGRALAQPKQGMFMVGGGAYVSYYYSESNNYPTVGGMPGPYTYSYSSFRISLAPNLGYFISDNVVLGCGVSPGINIYSGWSSSSSFLNSYSYGDLSIGISPFIRYFFSEIGAKMYPFATLGLGFSPQSLTLFSTGPVSNRSFANYSGTVGIGLAYFITPNTSIEPSISYNFSYAVRDQDTQKSSNLSLGIGFQIYLASLTGKEEASK